MAFNKKVYNKVSKFFRRDQATGTIIDSGPFIGVVTNNVDPTRSGRLQVYIPDLGDDPNDPTGWRTVNYASPFMGITNTAAGSQSTKFSDVGHTYGFWMVPPDLGVRVLVIFVAGKAHAGYWFACIPPDYGHNMVPGIAASTFLDTDLTVNDPNDPTQTIDKPDENIEDEKVRKTYKDAQSMWGLPVAELNVDAWDFKDNVDLAEVPKPIHEAQYLILLEQGLVGDGLRGIHSSSSQRESPSNVFGFSTPGRLLEDSLEMPTQTTTGDVDQDLINIDYRSTKGRKGGHMLVMDDGSLADGYDQLIKLRTSDGHQILLNDTENLIYIIHKNGKSWLEMTGDGQVNVYTDSGFNLRTQGTINMHADLDINIHASRKLNMYAGKGAQLDTSELKVNSSGKFLLAAGSIGMKSTGALNLYAGGGGSFGASGQLTFSGSCIGLNSGAAPSVESPTPLPLLNFPEAQKNSEGLWKATPNILKSIVSIAPTHEPYERVPGRTSDTYSSDIQPPVVEPPTSTPISGDMISIVIEFLKKHEGLPKGGFAYPDPPGQSTLYSIGYGHQIKDSEYAAGYIDCGNNEKVQIQKPITQTKMTPDQAGNLLAQKDIQKYVTAAKKPFTEVWEKLNPYQQAALVSYAYNTGSTSSLVTRSNNEIILLIKQNQFAAAGGLITTKGITTAGGKPFPPLERRRRDETALWNTTV